MITIINMITDETKTSTIDDVVDVLDNCSFTLNRDKIDMIKIHKDGISIRFKNREIIYAKKMNGCYSFPVRFVD